MRVELIGIEVVMAAEVDCVGRCYEIAIVFLGKGELGGCCLAHALVFSVLLCARKYGC